MLIIIKIYQILIQVLIQNQNQIQNQIVILTVKQIYQVVEVIKKIILK